MKTSIFPAAAFAALGVFGVAPLSLQAQQPPIIDRALFFGEEEIAGGQISSNGQYFSFLSPTRAGRKQMYTRMADPTTAEGKALLVAESPLTRAKAIVTPIDGGSRQERLPRQYPRE